MGKNNPRPERAVKKYFRVISEDPNNIDPREMYYPLAQQTTELMKIFAKRKFVQILNKQDIHRYFSYKTTIGDPENQLWVGGDTLFVNQNPLSPVQIRNMCMKTRRQCVGQDGDVTGEYFSICPHCNHIYVAVRATKVPCDYCRRIIDCEETDTNKMKWIKYSCINCPANLGLDEANLNLEYAYNNQFPRRKLK